ncbi:MAG TPA: hypothetical protein VIA45_09745 [Thermoanaerobaculia bacterium]
MSFALKNPSELLGRVGVAADESLLLVDAPEPLVDLFAAARGPEAPVEAVSESRLRAVKDAFDAVLVWREDRVGSQALLAAAEKRLRPSGVIWVVTAMRKVSGPRTPAAHRLDRRDLEKAFAKSGRRLDRETRFSAWHTGYRFAPPTPAEAAGRTPKGGAYST